VGGNIWHISNERRDLIAGLLAHANSNGGSPTENEIQSLEKSIAEARSQETSIEHKITDRDLFLEGVFFTQKVIGNMRNEGRLRGLRAGLDQKKILRGIYVVKVLVEGMNPEVEKYGLTQQLLQTDTELRLRQHGIRVGTSLQSEEEKAFKRAEQKINERISLTWLAANCAESDQEFLKYASAGIRLSELLYPHLLSASEQLNTLYINVNAIVFEENGRAAFSIKVALQEISYLYRNGTMAVADVWEKNCIAGCSTGRLKEYVRECLRDFVDEFINDYLAANPKDHLSEDGS